MSTAAKTQKDQQTHEHCSENEQRVQTHQKKPMSLPAKTQKYLKKNEHCTENEEGVQTHQKTHEHSNTNTKI